MSRSAATQLAQSAKQACQPLSMLSSAEKNRALKMMAEAVRDASSSILNANLADLAAARKAGFQPAMTARLALDEKKIQKIADSILSIAELPDPVGRKLWEKKRPNGLVIQKISVPIGSILIIYESRPNVTADCMALCLKSGNAVILKGGKEAHRTNRAIFSAMSRAARNAGIPKSFAHLVEGKGRIVVKELLQLSDWIDLVIPRGGEGLIREVARNSRIPVIKHYKGVCHVYVDASADLEKAERIVLNAKTQNPAVCNAMECLLVHEKIAPRFLPALGRSLQEKGVEIHADRLAARWLTGSKPATSADWGKEYLELKMAAKVVKDVHQAIEHIRRYGSGHSEGIVTENEACAALFKAAVDSSAVFVNCSTRFNDGGEFGMGAEMGISTDKLHARGPMGLEELTSYKYIVSGDGQIRG